MENKPTPADFSPNVPDFPSIGQYQPIYGKFDLTTYIQGASDYEIMAFLVQCYNATLKGYGEVTKLSKDSVTAYNQLQTWVNTWFNNLDVKQDIDAKLEQMLVDGELSSVIASSDSMIPAIDNYFASEDGNAALSNKTSEKINNMAANGTLADIVKETNQVPPAVTQYLNTVDGNEKLSNATAEKINNMAATGELGTVISGATDLQKTTTDWLHDNVTPVGSAVVVDKSLTIEGAAADSKATGNSIDSLKDGLVNATGISYIDKSELNIVGYLRNDGTLVPLTNTDAWVSSDYIEVSDLSKIYYKLHGLNTSSGIKVANVVLCDVNKTAIKFFYIQETTSDNGEDYIRVIDVPPYCKYIRICSYSGKDYEFICIKNNESMPNVYDATNYFTTENGFINPNGVFKEVIDAGWYATDYINVSEFNRIDYNLKGSNAVSIVCVYDSSYNLINKVVPTSSSEEAINGTLDITNGKYIRLCSYGYVGKNLLYSVANKEKQQWENIVSKPYLFNGKNALFFGDSITKGYINGNEITENGYPKLFSDSVGMNYTNYGVGGATMSRVSGYGCIYDQIINATFSNVDFVFVAGGVNDWQLGVSLSYFRTGVINICNYLKSNFNGEVIFITPIENAGWKPSTTPIADIDEYRNIISEVALTNGYSLINGKTLNFPNKDSNALLISTLFGDKLHPTEKGYIQYSKGLRTILC